MRLHLLDATFELFRAYYAMPSERAPDGREVGAVRGLISTTLALLQGGDVTHLAAATDHVIESFRNDLFVGYKTGDGIPADLWAQFPLAEDALRALGVVVWPMTIFEADDALATGAHLFANNVDQVVILSPDKDMAQCVSGERIIMHDRLRRKSYDEAGVREKFGVGPASIPETTPTAFRVFPAGDRSPPPPCCRATKQSKRFPSTLTAGQPRCVNAHASPPRCTLRRRRRNCTNNWRRCVAMCRSEKVWPISNGGEPGTIFIRFFAASWVSPAWRVVRRVGFHSDVPRRSLDFRSHSISHLASTPRL